MCRFSLFCSAAFCMTKIKTRFAQTVDFCHTLCSQNCENPPDICRGTLFSVNEISYILRCFCDAMYLCSGGFNGFCVFCFSMFLKIHDRSEEYGEGDA